MSEINLEPKRAVAECLGCEKVIYEGEYYYGLSLDTVTAAYGPATAEQVAMLPRGGDMSVGDEVATVSPGCSEWTMFCMACGDSRARPALMQAMLKEFGDPVFCRPSSPTVVIDGNHRLAAALKGGS